jgi:hypothetical protein
VAKGTTKSAIAATLGQLDIHPEGWNPAGLEHMILPVNKFSTQHNDNGFPARRWGFIYKAGPMALCLKNNGCQ